MNSARELLLETAREVEGAHHIGPSEGTAIYAAIPEPGTYALLLAGLTLVAGFKPALRLRQARRSAAPTLAG